MSAAMEPLDWMPMPDVTKLCSVCGVTEAEVDQGYVLVSPRGIAHHGHSWRTGDTVCGRDATGQRWWWPL